MKKILAVLVAVLMMALPFASAQEAFYFADPVLSMGEGMDIDLTGLELVFAVIMYLCSATIMERRLSV